MNASFLSHLKTIILELVLVVFQYILVVFALDIGDKQVESPMEIQVLVEDVNDNAPVCVHQESVFEVQEGEPGGKMCVCVCVCDHDITHS